MNFRAHTAIQPGHSHCVRQDLTGRRHQRGQGPAINPTILVQRQGRSLRGLHRRRTIIEMNFCPTCTCREVCWGPGTTAKPSRCNYKGKTVSEVACPSCSESSSSRSPASIAIYAPLSTWGLGRRLGQPAPSCPAVRPSAAGLSCRSAHRAHCQHPDCLTTGPPSDMAKLPNVINTIYKGTSSSNITRT